MHPFTCHVSFTLPACPGVSRKFQFSDFLEKNPNNFNTLCSGMEMRTRLSFISSQLLCFQAFSAVFNCCPTEVALLARQPLFLTCGSLQMWLLPPPTEMHNPRWEQRVSAFSKTQFRPDKIWSYPRLSALSTWGFNSHDSCLWNQLEGQSLASDMKSINSCLSCCFWKTQFRMKIWTEPRTSETKARNSTRRVANQYNLLLRHSGRHATHLQISCIGISHLPSLWFAFFMKEVRLWINLKSF